MADVSKLKQAIKDKTGFTDRHINRLIAEKASAELLEREVAIMAVARDNGIAITKYASAADLALLRVAAGREPSVAATPAPAAQVTTKRAATRRAAPKPREKPRGRKKIFVVHGRNDALRRDMFAFLRAIGLSPIEWSKGLKDTKSGSPSIKMVLDAMFDQAAAVLVLLTPDDTARLKQEFWSKDEPAHEKRYVGQARPNVLFEAGMALGSHPDSVVFVRVGNVKGFTDIDGIHVTRLNNSAEKRQEVANKLEAAGCLVDTGGTDWYNTGDFEPGDGKGKP